MFGKERLFQSLLAEALWHLIVFPIYFSTHPNLFMKQLVWLGYHNFSWNSSLFWILSIVRLSFNCFAAWFWTRPLKHRMFNWVQSSRTVFFDISLLNHGFSDCLLAFGIARLTFKCCLSRFWLFQKFSIFRPN